jgi:hypothetical protein
MKDEGEPCSSELYRFLPVLIRLRTATQQLKRKLGQVLFLSLASGEGFTSSFILYPFAT